MVENSPAMVEGRARRTGQRTGPCASPRSAIAQAWLAPLAAVVVFALALPAIAAGAPRLHLPLKCTPGRNCLIQKYPDNDPGPGVQDFLCGGRTDNGHSGTDVRPIIDEEGRYPVTVTAIASGRVVGVRNNVPDHDASKTAIAAAVNAGKECGNGIAIAHGNGWVSQVCHLRQGSIRVRAGERVAVAAPIAEIGLTGATQYPHVHLTLWHNKVRINPFTGRPPANDCKAVTGLPDSQMWIDRRNLEPGKADEGIIEAGFASRPTRISQLVKLPVQRDRPSVRSPRLLFYGWAINLAKGDRLYISLIQPGGRTTSELRQPLTRPRAHELLFIGRKRRGSRWPPGSYKGIFEVRRGGQTVHRESRTMTIPE